MRDKKWLIIIAIVVFFLLLIVGIKKKNNNKEIVDVISKPMRVCPEQWISNKMPVVDGGTNPDYFVWQGKRYELSDFDMTWVNANCNLKKVVVE